MFKMKSLVDNLSAKGFKVHCFNTAQEAKAFFQNEIFGTSVGFGGSVTISQLGLYDMLKERNRVFFHSVDKSPDVLANAAAAEVYILGANAVSQTGEIVNIDGRGNRVSGCIWGANRKRVYIVFGENKITEDLPSAIFRARNIAAPQNARRLNLKTPCAIKADKCYNCNSPQKICRVLTVLSNPTSAETHIVIISEDLGY